MKTLTVAAMLSILSDIAALAQRVVEGELAGSSAASVPDSMTRVVLPSAPKVKSVDEVVSLGAILLARWCMRHKGPGALQWPEMLQSWLDRWENDFRASFDGDERAGYRELLGILQSVRRAVQQSQRVQ